MKKEFSKMLAVFCAVAMIVNAVGIQFPAKASEANASLTELTFSDFGLVDDTYDTQVFGTYNNAATLVGTKISGYVTLNEDLKNELAVQGESIQDRLIREVGDIIPISRSNPEIVERIRQWGRERARNVSLPATTALVEPG